MFKLINDDCLKAMNGLINDNVKVDLILTDPPYGTLKNIQLKGWDKDTTKWDDVFTDKGNFLLL